MSQPSFEEIVRAWTLEYDERLPSDRKERREAFIVLLGNLKDHGYGKEELNNSRKEKIVRSCVNPNHHNKKKLRTWISMVVNDLDAAVLIFFGTVKIRRDVVTAEMQAKLESMERRAEETKALKSPDVDQEDDGSNPDKPLDLENEALDIESSVKDAIENPKKETFEITEEMLESMDSPEIVWDEDFMKKLESGDE
jgi:hypothetical protein